MVTDVSRIYMYIGPQDLVYYLYIRCDYIVLIFIYTK